MLVPDLRCVSDYDSEVRHKGAAYGEPSCLLQLRLSK